MYAFKKIKLLFLSLPLYGLVACGGGGGGSSNSGSVDTVGPSGGAAPAAISWYSAAGPLLERYCVSCHIDGGAAPFSLQSHEQVQAKLSAMIFSLEADTMPPPGYADPTAAERQLLLEWLENGAPKGHPDDRPVSLPTALTYHGDARAIIEQACVDCHQSGGIAPFPLDTFARVKAVAAAAAFSIENGQMPPWPPTPGYSRFSHDRGLAPEQRAILLEWLYSDLAEGDSSAYVPPTTEISVEPKFNLKMPLPQAYTPTLRPDDHRCFAIEWPLDEFSYVTAVSVVPDQVEEVHHVIVSIAEPEDAELYYGAGGADGRPGWYCLGAGGVSGAPFPRQIGGWVPGGGNGAGPEGLGSGVKPGSVMIVQMHYNTLVAQPTPDQSTVLVETRSEVTRPARSFLLTNPGFLSRGGMPIPAGDPSVSHEWSVPAFGLAQVFGKEAGVSLRDPWVIHQGFLHMHNLGKAGRTTLVRADGTEQVILDIRDWDFNWQDTYFLERELLVQPNDHIKIECTWDNSQENQQFVNGKQQQTQDVEWGDGTSDEMCLMSILMTKPKAGYDYSYAASVHIESPSYRQQFAAGDLVPLKLIFNNFTLHDPAEHSPPVPALYDSGEHTSDGDDHGGVFSGHYHVYLDSNDDEADHLTAWNDNYYYQLPADLSAGKHTLRVSLRGPDHHALDIEQTVEIIVGDAAANERESLVNVDSWRMNKADTDTLSAHRPAAVECPDNSWYNEDGALEVETGYCNYLSLSQPSLAAVKSGDSVHLVLWHGDLAFERPANAHVAVTINGRKVWDAEVEIPTQANIYDLRIPVNFNAPVGSTVEYHLHNHGYNTWTLLQLDVERAD